MYDDYWDYGYGGHFLLPKADNRVSYREGGTQANRCYDCRYYLYGACAVVEGVIEASWVCDLFTSPPEVFPRSSDESGGLVACEVSTIAAKGRPWRMFTELATPLSASEPPEWIPLLPLPGLYRHPVYGDLDISEDRNARFVENFNAGVYQSLVPLDAEHQSKLSGAVAWMDSLRQNDDGSVDAHIKEWTPRGQSLMEEGAYKYISPEWFDVWEDPADGKLYADIVIGAALTNHPFFKDKALRPLVASEGKLVVGNILTDRSPDRDRGKPVAFRELTRLPRKAQEENPVSVNPNPPRNDPAPQPQPVVSPQQFSELERRFTELSERLTTTTGELEVTRRANETLTTQLEGATSNIASMQAAERSRRFTDMATGRGGANDGGHPWPGDAADHVVVLEALAATESVEDGPFQRYVRTQRAAAEQNHVNAGLARTAAQTNITAEVGSAALGRTSGSARSEADGLVRTMREQEPGLSVALAEQKLWESRPDLYGRVREEERRYASEHRPS
jgi:hypothetical protein